PPAHRAGPRPAASGSVLAVPCASSGSEASLSMSRARRAAATLILVRRSYHRPMQRDIERVLISGERIARRVGELAEQITADHSPPRMPGDAQITIVPILTGAMIFAADLIRAIPLPMRIDLVTVSSYPGQSIRSHGSQVLGRQLEHVRGRH